MNFSEFKNLAESIFHKMHDIPLFWDGRESILDMKNSGNKNWRQMEWNGFYFEFLCNRHLTGIMDMPGPVYGNTSFDGFYKIPWDLKSHAMNSSSRQKVIGNDREATESALKEHGSVGLLLALGEVVYDDNEKTFKQWHDRLKGKVSDYEKQRIARGARSRKRKISFSLKQICAVRLNDDVLARTGNFQQGFRNKDGSPRRTKVKMDLKKLKNNDSVYWDVK